MHKPLFYKEQSHLKIRQTNLQTVINVTLYIYKDMKIFVKFVRGYLNSVFFFFFVIINVIF